MTTINTPAVVDASGTAPLDIVKLSSTLSMVIYEDAGNLLRARTITFGNPPTVNAEVNIDTISGVSSHLAVLVGLTATSAMIIYENAARTSALARILTVSGTTITVQSALTLTEDPTAMGACFVTSTKVLWCYRQSGGNGRAVMLSVAGTTITENSIITVQSGILFGVRCASYSATRAVMTWTINTGGRSGRAINISGNTLTTPNAAKVIIASVSSSDNTIHFIIALSATKLVTGTINQITTDATYNVLTLNGTNFDIGAASTKALTDNSYLTAAKLTDTSLIIANNDPTDTLDVEKFTLSGGSSDELTAGDSDTLAFGSFLTNIAAAPVDDDNIIIHYEGSSTSVVGVVAALPATHIWLSTDGGATYSNIGDSAWAANLVGGVVVVPGTAYGTLFAAVGTNLYKTVNGGTAWTLETAVGYEVDFIDLEKDNTTVFLAKRDAAGANRASLWDSVGASLTHINTGKSTTGGATSGGDVV